MMDKVGDQRLERDGIAENGEYVEEIDALLSGSMVDCTTEKERRTGLGKSGYMVTILCRKSTSDMAGSGLGEGRGPLGWSREREKKSV